MTSSEHFWLSFFAQASSSLGLVYGEESLSPGYQARALAYFNSRAISLAPVTCPAAENVCLGNRKSPFWLLCEAQRIKKPFEPNKTVFPVAAILFCAIPDITTDSDVEQM